MSHGICRRNDDMREKSMILKPKVGYVRIRRVPISCRSNISLNLALAGCQEYICRST